MLHANQGLYTAEPRARKARKTANSILTLNLSTKTVSPLVSTFFCHAKFIPSQYSHCSQDYETKSYITSFPKTCCEYATFENVEGISDFQFLVSLLLKYGITVFSCYFKHELKKGVATVPFLADNRACAKGNSTFQSLSDKLLKTRIEESEPICLMTLGPHLDIYKCFR